jgi:cell division septal protein FtsQ
MSTDPAATSPRPTTPVRLLRGMRRALLPRAKRRRHQTLQAWRARRSPETPAVVAPEQGIRVRARRRAPTPPVPAVVSRARRRMRAPVVIVALVGCIAMAAAGAYVWRAPALRVHGAEVTGNRRVPAETIYRVSMLDGAWLPALDRAAAERRIELLEDVRAAHVKVAWPAHVTVAVVETPLVLRWEAPDGTLAIDDTGRAVAVPTDADDLPAVRDESGIVASPGDRMAPEVVDAARRYVERFASLVYRRDTGFTTTTSEGWEVRLGSDPVAVERQTAVLEALRAQLAPAGAAVAFVDLQYPSRPYYRLRGGAN